ncbi:MAG: extracellular solute-binding protein [Clostridia bacterium]|nr:extracellular solute-binding protein [Clostridia bacterium]
MKKILSLILCCIFLFGCVSCANEQQEDINLDYNSGISGDVDLDGKHFVFAMVQDYFFEGADSTLGFINTTEFADLAAERLRDVQEKHNCTIEFKYVPRAGDAAYKDVMSGECTIDIIQDETYWLLSYVPMGIFVDLTTVDSLDVTDEEKWGNRYMLYSMMWNGAIYGVLPAQHPLRTQNSMGSVLGINETHVQSLGEVDPRDYYENGEWTWDTFTRVLTDYTLTSLGGDQIYALVSSPDRLPMAAAFSNGGEYITMKSDGTFNLGIFSDESLEAFNQVSEWINGPTSANIHLDYKDCGRDYLKAGTAVIGMLDAYQVLSGTDSIAYTLENFGIVPFPTGPDAEPRSFKSFYDAADFTLCIPITEPDVEETAFVLDAIYEPFEGYETDEDIIDYLHANYFLDRRDAEYYYSLSDIEHAYYFPSMDRMYDDIWPPLAEKNPIEVLEAQEESMYARAEEHLIPRSNSIIEVYGE